MAISGFTPKFNPKDIANKLLEKKAGIETAIINRLRFVGEKFVINARTNGQYKDRTGNLRNSIGYVILKDGEQIISNFERSATIQETTQKGKTKISKGSKDGLAVGQQKADEAASKFPRGLVLIVVAGMDYAAAVESKNYDVLTSSSIIAEGDLRKSLEQLRAKLK